MITGNVNLSGKVAEGKLEKIRIVVYTNIMMRGYIDIERICRIEWKEKPFAENMNPADVRRDLEETEVVTR